MPINVWIENKHKKKIKPGLNEKLFIQWRPIKPWGSNPELGVCGY